MQVKAPMMSFGENRGNDRDKRALEFIEKVTTKAEEVQAEVLSAILTRNADTEYLKRYGLSGYTDRETFKKCLPVITYDDIKPDIHRIANGDTSPILSAHPITEFILSTGTSGGQSKLVPTIEEDMERRALLMRLVMPIMNQSMQGLDKGKGMYFLFINSESKTPGGLPARCSSTRWYKNRFLKESGYDPYKMYTSPLETILCPDAYQSMYCQLLCGLLQNSEVLRMGAIFASGFLRTIRFLEEHWRQLCLDIKTGILNKGVTDPSVREAVEKLLQHPNQELAELIQRECSAHSWQGIITRLWPNTKYIKVIVTGAMAQYIPTLDYYSGGLPLVCTMYSSSEGSFGLNLNPLCKPTEVSYTLLPNMAYFEFLPVHREDFDLTVESPASPKTVVNEKEQEDLVKLVDVKVGQEYELVVTTYAGLYRYRMGDVLRVTGFHNAAPQFHFVCRQNVVLSIHTEKTDEAELQSSVEKSVMLLEPFDITLMDYTSYADTSTVPGHYVLYWELRFNTKEFAGSVPSSVFEDCCLSVEESLNSVYRQGRAADKSIGPLEIKVVKEGTFDQLMDHALQREASLNQYKAPRCVKNSSMIELLNSRVIDSYFSPCSPKWVPGSAVSSLWDS